MNEPLASRYRPKSLEEFIGQKHLVGKDGPLFKFINSGNIPSMLFWGPPGTGKTTLAFIISQNLFYDFHKLQAVSAGKEQLKKVLAHAMNNQNYGRKTILFIDEIHRWNKAQQDALLPFVEKGIVTLIGATTENPSFRVNNALLSRCKVFVFEQHSASDISGYVKDIFYKEFPTLKAKKEVFDLIGDIANGDVRSALNILEMAISISDQKSLKKEDITNTVQKQIYYDKDGEEHYNIISAIHKSLRSSNGDAACYWITRMLDSGEDPLYIARRLLRFASEDIGNADINAVILANTVYDTVAKLGMPESDVHLIQLAKYLANAPKDNSAYTTSSKAKKDVKDFGNLPVPLHLRNAPTDLMKSLNYSKGYEYDHDLDSKKSKQQCFPDKLKNRVY
jgi:putative ATPase